MRRQGALTPYLFLLPGLLLHGKGDLQGQWLDQIQQQTTDGPVHHHARYALAYFGATADRFFLANIG